MGNAFRREAGERAVKGNVSIEVVAEKIKAGEIQRICFMTGAGISTAAGIPDFRSPNFGLYFTMAKKFRLTNPMNLFQIDYYRKNPEPFLYLAREMLKMDVKPTVSHYFQHLLDQKGLLLRSFTQNVDALELVAGLHEARLVEAHGSARGAHCLSCRKAFSREWFADKVVKEEIPRCDSCNNLTKPDIVFFGEQLPMRFFTAVQNDLPKCDLLIIMGTSLVVHPFASMIDRVPRHTPRLLINREKVTGGGFFSSLFGGGGGGLSFDSVGERDVFFQGDCDDGCRRLAELMGCGEELKELVERGHRDLDEKAKNSGGVLGIGGILASSELEPANVVLEGSSTT